MAAKKFENRKNPLYIRKDDIVVVNSGKEIGKKGRVLKVFPEKKRLIVEKINMIHRHQRPSQRQQKGGIIEKEGTIHVSNLQLWCSKCNLGCRVGFDVLSDGSKVRVCRRCGEILDK